MRLSSQKRSTKLLVLFVESLAEIVEPVQSLIFNLCQHFFPGLEVDGQSLEHVLPACLESQDLGGWVSGLPVLCQSLPDPFSEAVHLVLLRLDIQITLGKQDYDVHPIFHSRLTV